MLGLHKLNSKVYSNAVRVALITAPLFGLIGAVPVLEFEKVQASKLAMGFVSVLSVTLLFWLINILLLRFFERLQFTGKEWIRFICSAAICVAVTYIMLRYFLPANDHMPPEEFRHLPKMPFRRHRPMLLAFLQSQSVNVIILVLLELIVLRDKKQKIETENAALRLANLEARHMRIKQQLHPHFLFNSLNVLGSLIRRSPEHAEPYLIKLSNLLRLSVNSDAKTIIPLQEELQLGRDYMSMQQIRFGDALAFDIDVPEGMLAAHVPVYSLQLLLENAIKHNIATVQMPLRIAVKGDEEAGTITVFNNLQLKAADGSSSKVGLANLSERYRILSREEVVISKEDNIFSVTIKVLDP